MNVVEKTAANLKSNSADFDRFRLRRFIEDLAGMGELDTRGEPVDLAGIAEVLEAIPRRCCSAPPVPRRPNWSAA